jgi:SPP1 family phage portal protein
MVLKKISKERLEAEDVLKYIKDYLAKEVPKLDDLWEYYKGKNVKILNRKTPDPNNPDEKITVSYARKLVNTYTGYAFRPGYITYKANKAKEEKKKNDKIELDIEKVSEEDLFLNEVTDIFDINDEPIKTNRHGRNLGIFGLSYELFYIDSETEVKEGNISYKNTIRFFVVDPREMIVLYDFSPEPKLKIGIRFYKLDNDDEYKVEVYYKDIIDTFKIFKDNNYEWKIEIDELGKMNVIKEIPIIAFYQGDEIQSIFENVLRLIDAYDVLFSDSMNEFDRFAFAYLIMKKFGLTNPLDKKDPTKLNWALKLLKRRRVFENIPGDGDIKFLTKDIPTSFIEHIGKQLRDQIHIQSHVPDFTSEKMTGASGIAILRLMFDFENLVSSTDADFDTGLYKRINIIANYLKLKGENENYHSKMIIINHKRNIPLNAQDFAQAALVMQNAGFSRKAIIGIMPEDIIPDPEEELKLEMEEREMMIGDSNLFDENTISEEQQQAINDLINDGYTEEAAKEEILGNK